MKLENIINMTNWRVEPIVVGSFHRRVEVIKILGNLNLDLD
jgi:hypothetical protein